MSDDLFPGFEAHWIDTEAGRIFARSAGSGPPLVMLHGFRRRRPCGTGSRRSWPKPIA
jgi:haloacetate dehalogenase